MKITKRQFEVYLKVIPPVIWAWIYTEVKDGTAKSALKAALFDEADSLRDLTQPWIRDEVNYLVSKFPEIRSAAEKSASNFYIKNSWREWLPWNWSK